MQSSMSMLVYIDTASNVKRLALGGRSKLSSCCLSGNKSFKIGVLFGDDRLKYVIEPFSDGMDKTSTVRATRSGADRSLVNLSQQVEVPKRNRAVLEGVVPNVVYHRF